MRKIHILLLAVLAVSCQKTVVTGFQDKPVVEAYLYVGESPSVKISKLIAYTSDMVFSSEDVAKLAVTITESPSGKSYTMLSNGDGTYQNSDLIVKAGSSYQLSFPYNGMTVTATTVAPAEPQGLTLSENTISIGQSAGFGGGEMPSMINVSWSNKDSSYYFIYVKNVEVVKEAINTRTEAGKDFFRNTPTNMDQYEINPRSFQYYGQHRIILYRIRPEYVLFFQDNSSSSLSITEIRANIQNGFGIFTAINSASAYLYVGKP